MNPIKLIKIMALEGRLLDEAKENEPMNVKVPHLLTLFCSLAAAIGLPELVTKWVQGHLGVYMGVVAVAIVLHAVLPSVFAAPSDAAKKAAGLGVVLFFLVAASNLQAQSGAGGLVPQPASPIQNLYGAGVSYSVNATPSIAGSALYAHALGTTGTYAFTHVDALPNTLKPFVVTTNIGGGVAQKIFTLGGVDFFAPTAAGISLNGSNTGWQWNGGVLAAIHVKGKYFLLPTARFLKSSVSNGTGYQPIIGIEFGIAQ